jgi:hypothetical protein
MANTNYDTRTHSTGRRVSTETKASVKTSELIAYVLAVLGVLIASAMVDAVAASTGAGPTDAAVSPDGGSLHVRMRDGSVSSFTIGAGGSLTSAGSAFVAATFGVAGLVGD